MIFVKWFGWSVLWLLPLLLRTVARALGRKSIFGGRGAIRLWCGSLLLLAASGALEALVRAQLSNSDDGPSGDLVGAALMEALGGKISKGIAAVVLLALLALGLKWLLGAIFGRNDAQSRDDHPELDLGPPRRGSIESERVRLSSQRSSFPAGAERRMPAVRQPGPARTSGAASNRAPVGSPYEARPRPARLTPAPANERPLDGSAREDWKVPLSALTGGQPRHAQAGQGGQAGKWPSLNPRPSGPAAKARPESEWAAFETLRPTEAMLARAAASRAISAASAAADASLSRAASPALPIRPIPSSIARSASDQQAAPSPLNPTRSIRISSVGRAAPQAAAPSGPPPRADVIPTRLMRSLHEADGLQNLTPAAAPIVPVVPVVPMAPPSPLPSALQDQLIPDLPTAPELPQSDAGWPPAEPAQVPAVPASAPEAFLPADDEPIDLGTFSAPWFDMLPDPAPPTSPPLQQQPAFTVRMPEPQPTEMAPVARVYPELEDEPRVDIPLPSLDLLDEVPESRIEIDPEQLQETGRLIEQRLKEFKVPVTVLGAEAGPVITRFEVEPAQGVRGAQVVNLMKDLSRALGLTSIRVVETIPGKTCMGLELPNARRQMIKLSEIIHSQAYRKSSSHLTIAMGKDITGTPVVTDLARAPHMLVAGTTGSGKSVAINAMILSLLYKATPEEVRMIMIDPKMLELSIYEGIPHLLAPVVTDMREAAHALNWAVDEMERRYKKMSKLGVRNLAGYNQKLDEAAARGEKIPNPFSLTPDAPEPLEKLPTIVIVIDELADLMMVVGKKVEELIARLAQKARAAGIHLILATQRPSVDVITGLIKANIPTRVAFQVSSKIDSRTVLDQMGAESLLGHGDMLFLPPGSGYPQRVHGAFVSDEEVHRVVEYLKSFGEPRYIEEILAPPMSEDTAQADMFAGGEGGDPESDPLYDEAVAFVLKTRRASISSVQRQLRIGYNRAARLVEQMETAGVLSAMSRNGSRDILVPPSGGEE
ncbi:DNA translocase FtsK [Herbaspirillum sp. AP02]|uniref:DNA translocase FtsK n=1 Tax=unclassified Herbaspirillum TaxID=2624150 RepID=UPI0015DB3D1C|nr:MULTISPECIES: DNA translocase FtsK [unclassified Herbaspirillum]MBG7619772.1 DNA translocase FtsK [Herbaspirillum sp. AP02]NZD69843.1 DNA translocase FtsK [Herbaspirillum sp. AP21]